MNIKSKSTVTMSYEEYDAILGRKVYRPSVRTWLIASYAAGFALFVAGFAVRDIPTLFALYVPAVMLMSIPVVVEFVPYLRNRVL